MYRIDFGNNKEKLYLLRDLNIFVKWAIHFWTVSSPASRIRHSTGQKKPVGSILDVCEAQHIYAYFATKCVRGVQHGLVYV